MTTTATSDSVRVEVGSAFRLRGVDVKCRTLSCDELSDRLEPRGMHICMYVCSVSVIRWRICSRECRLQNSVTTGCYWTYLWAF